MAISEDEVLETIDDWELDPRTDTLAAASEFLSRMAVGDPGRLDVQQVIADHQMMRGEIDAGLRTLAQAEVEARASGAAVHLDEVQAARVTALLADGRGDAAQPLLDELRKRGAAVAPSARLRIAETLEELGRLHDAMRWFTIGIRHIDPAVDLPDFDEELFLKGRLRVRQSLGHPADLYDELALELLEDRLGDERDEEE